MRGIKKGGGRELFSVRVVTCSSHKKAEVEKQKIGKARSERLNELRVRRKGVEQNGRFRL